jgi:uncharacterized SAM-binding protein YcdF (DUF218 family)
MRAFLRILVRWARRLLMAVGLVTLLALAACFGPLPWKLVQWLANDGTALDRPPDYIVLFGGGGIPSESGLTRAFETARAARDYPGAVVILALPYDTELAGSAAGRMREELIWRGVLPERIRIEPHGRNTREQALNFARNMGLAPERDRILVVTSPEHMRRAMMSLRKVGFCHVAGRASFSEAIETNVLYDPDELGGRKISLPTGSTLMMRYQFWNNLGYLSTAARELAALAYYALKGWI